MHFSKSNLQGIFLNNQKKTKKKTYKGYYGKYNWTTTLGDTMKILKKKRLIKKIDILISQI